MLLVRPRGLHLPERHLRRGRRARWPARSWTSPSTCTATPTSCSSAARGPYFYLPKLESHLEARCGATRSDRRGGLGLERGHDQGHRPDRDPPGRLRDGRDPLRAARPRGRPERGPLGLHLLGHQALPHAARFRAPGPLGGDDDRAVHARLHRAAREDLPRARRARHGRDVGGDPEPHRRGGQPARVRGRARGQGARGRRRLRRHLGRSPRLGAGGHRGLRRRAGRPPQPGGPPPRRRGGRAPTTCSPMPDTPGEVTEDGPALERERGHPVHLVVAARQRRGRRSTG